MRKGMGTWKTRIFAKKSRASQTPGKKKGESCRADFMKKFMARRSRSYKHPLYSQWCRACDAMNGRKASDNNAN